MNKGDYKRKLIELENKLIREITKKENRND